MEPILALNSTQSRISEITSKKLSGLSWYRLCLTNVFQPNDYLMSFIQPYLDRFKDHYVIGFHARMGQGVGKWHDGKTFLKMGSVTYQVSGIKKLMEKKGNAVLFLSTDSDKVEKHFQMRFRNRLIVVDSLPRMHVGKSKVDEMGVIRSFVDMYLLGQCNYLYLTPNSGFSYAGLALNRKNPVVVYL